jgi:NAD(P)-dependent dehydrogenase (short-subunit alcohol dehydrogenase family)
MMAGLLFTRAGVKTIVLETHENFLREFRGDTVHPSTLRIFSEIGLLEKFVQRPHDKVRSVAGAIVNMASMYGLKAGDLGNAPYCASKFGVVGLSKTAAIDYADKGVRMNAICPGFIHSEMADPYMEAEPELMARPIHRHSAMKRVGESDEIAEAVTCLLAPQSSFVNGTEHLVSGAETSRLC